MCFAPSLPNKRFPVHPTISPSALIDEIKRFVRFSPEDQVVVRELCKHAKPHFPEIATEFYERVREHADAHAVFRDEEQIARLHASLVAWLERVLTGPWDEAYCEKSLRIGRVHVQVGLPQRYMFTAMSLFRTRLEAVAERTMGDRAHVACRALSRILDMDLALMNETYREAYVAREHDRESGYTIALAARGSRLSDAQLNATERALKRYVHAVELAGAIIIGLDSKGKIRIFNRRAEHVTGYPFAEVEGKSFADTLLVSPESGFDELWEKVLSANEPIVLSARCDVRRRNGKIRELAGHASRAPGAHEDDIILVARDVTDEQVAAARVRQTERLAAVGTLAAGLAHEIRNPLNGAQLHLTFLKRALGKDGGGEVVDAVDVVAGEITRLSSLVSEFLDFARPSSLNRKAASIQELIRHAAGLTHVPENTTLALELPKTEIVVEIDVEKMEQVILNLLGNAVDAAGTSPPGRVTLRALSRAALGRDRGGRPTAPGCRVPRRPSSTHSFPPRPTARDWGWRSHIALWSDHEGSLECHRRGDETVFVITVPIEAPIAQEKAP